MLILKELHAENWKSWEELHLIDLDKQGLTLIQGNNGSGKSSIRMLIEYLLLDTMSDEFEVGDLPRDTNTSCTISCKILRGTDEIEITKYRNHSEHDNKTILKINDNDSLTHTDRRVTQKNIESLLEISQETLFASTLFSSRSPNFPESKESIRKQILYQILGLEKYNTYLQKVKDKLKEIDDKVQVNTMNLSMSDQKLGDLSYDLKESTKSQENWNKNKTEKLEGLLEQLNTIELTETKTLNDEVENLKISIKEYDKETYLKLEKEYREIELKFREIKLKTRLLTDEILNTEENICPILNESCKKLLQNHEIVKEKNDTELKKLDEEMSILIQKQSVLVKTIKDIKETINENERLQNNIDDLNHKILQIESQNLFETNKQNVLKERIKELKEEENIFKEITIKLEKDIERELALMEVAQKNDYDLFEESKYYEFWKIGYSSKGIPHLKAETFIESLELETNKILSIISNEIVEIASQKELVSGDTKEAITYRLHSPDKNIKNFKAYSSGQRQRVLIADKLSFHSLLGKFNFILFDEVLELSLDEQGKSSVLDLLKSYSKQLGSMFIISHDKEIQDKFDNVINIELKDGVSKIKEIK